MRLKRLGSLHQCRLSFMRILTRRMARDQWTFSRPVFDIDDKGVGRAVYTASGPERSYSLVCFAHDLPDELRSDRVIAEAWDTTFALFDGIPDEHDLDRLAENVPLQEAGRISERELSLSRANRSVRLWNHMVDALAAGSLPDADLMAEVGYLMRTTAVYGSGKFGAADREQISDRQEMHVPFQAEMLSVYLTRTFVRDLIQHLANAKGGAGAVRLKPDIARNLGIGNSTGLGMAPFIINHPVLFNNWIMVREEAIARVRSVEQASKDEIALFEQMLARARELVHQWTSEHPIQQQHLSDLRADLDRLDHWLQATAPDKPGFWDSLMTWAGDNLTEEGQELVASLILEPYGHLVDDLESCMADDLDRINRIDGSMPVAEICTLLEQTFEDLLESDFEARENCARAWYVSAEKLEPRLGERFEEPITKYEQPLATARDAKAAHRILATMDGEIPVAEFLLKHPEFRHTIRRAQVTCFAPYSEIRDNTISSALLPIDMLRAKLSFFGATRFDPRSDRWVRISMYGGAPYPDELDETNCDFWVYPEAGS